MAMRVSKPSTGKIAIADNGGRQIWMVVINAGIGNGHQAAKAGPAPGIGGAETGGGKRCLLAADMIFGRLVICRIRNGAWGRVAGSCIPANRHA